MHAWQSKEILNVLLPLFNNIPSPGQQCSTQTKTDMKPHFLFWVAKQFCQYLLKVYLKVNLHNIPKLPHAQVFALVNTEAAILLANLYMLAASAVLLESQGLKSSLFNSMASITTGGAVGHLLAAVTGTNSHSSWKLDLQ